MTEIDRMLNCHFVFLLVCFVAFTALTKEISVFSFHLSRQDFHRLLLKEANCLNSIFKNENYA